MSKFTQPLCLASLALLAACSSDSGTGAETALSSSEFASLSSIGQEAISSQSLGLSSASAECTGEIVNGTITDCRDMQSYPVIQAGSRMWIAKNLNYETTDGSISTCYDGKPANCATYGKLYNYVGSRSACPTGFRIPTNEEWDSLEVAAGAGWPQGINNADALGFNLVLGGFQNSSLNDYDLDQTGYWWTDSGAPNGKIYIRALSPTLLGQGLSEVAYASNFAFSVRCINSIK